VSSIAFDRYLYVIWEPRAHGLYIYLFASVFGIQNIEIDFWADDLKIQKGSLRPIILWSFEGKRPIGQKQFRQTTSMWCDLEPVTIVVRGWLRTSNHFTLSVVGSNSDNDFGFMCWPFILVYETSVVIQLG
jgi:hypothetical protein